MPKPVTVEHPLLHRVVVPSAVVHFTVMCFWLKIICLTTVSQYMKWSLCHTSLYMFCFYTFNLEPSQKNGQHQISEACPLLQTQTEKKSWRPQEKMAMHRCQNGSNDLIHGGRWWWWHLILCVFFTPLVVNWNSVQLISGRAVTGMPWSLPRIPSKVGWAQCIGEVSIQERKNATCTPATCTHGCISSQYTTWLPYWDTTKNSIKVMSSLLRIQLKMINNEPLHNKAFILHWKPWESIT
jgi:hypothetical protein